MYLKVLKDYGHLAFHLQVFTLSPDKATSSLADATTGSTSHVETTVKPKGGKKGPAYVQSRKVIFYNVFYCQISKL